MLPKSRFLMRHYCSCARFIKTWKIIFDYIINIIKLICNVYNGINSSQNTNCFPMEVKLNYCNKKKTIKTRKSLTFKEVVNIKL